MVVSRSVNVSPASVSGSGTVTFVGDNVSESPRFCDPEACGDAPTVAGDYQLQEGSPCLAAASPCGELIGALGLGCTAVSAPDVGPAASAFDLRVAPNPLRRASRLRLADPGLDVRRALVFDVNGARVRGLTGPDATVSGSLDWDGRDDGGRPVRDGVYFVRVELADGRVETRKLTVVR